MKTFLVLCMLLIGMACYASGPVLKDCDPVSATVSQTIDPVQPAYILEAVVFYELPFAGTIPELGMPIESAELTGYSADIWHPPVFNSILWLSSNKIIRFSDYPLLAGNALNCRSDKLLIIDRTNRTEVFPISWYDIA